MEMTIEQTRQPKKVIEVAAAADDFDEDESAILTVSNDDDKLHFSENSFCPGGDDKGISDMMDNGLKRSQTVTLLINNSTKSEHMVNFEKNKRILIVDDEPYNLIGLTVIL